MAQSNIKLFLALAVSFGLGLALSRVYLPQLARAETMEESMRIAADSEEQTSEEIADNDSTIEDPKDLSDTEIKRPIRGRGQLPSVPFVPVRLERPTPERPRPVGSNAQPSGNSSSPVNVTPPNATDQLLPAILSAIFGSMGQTPANPCIPGGSVGALANTAAAIDPSVKPAPGSGGPCALLREALSQVGRMSSANIPGTGQRDENGNEIPGTEGAYACAAVINRIAYGASGQAIEGTWEKPGLSTHSMNSALAKSPNYQNVGRNCQAGDIIMSATQFNSGGKKKNTGHVGIVGCDQKVMSNSSGSKMFLQNYTVQSWINRYDHEKGLDVVCYRPVENNGGQCEMLC
jgi:hypothetical protein